MHSFTQEQHYIKLRIEELKENSNSKCTAHDTALQSKIDLVITSLRLSFEKRINRLLWGVVTAVIGSAFALFLAVVK